MTDGGLLVELCSHTITSEEQSSGGKDPSNIYFLPPADLITLRLPESHFWLKREVSVWQDLQVTLMKLRCEGLKWIKIAQKRDIPSNDLVLRSIKQGNFSIIWTPTNCLRKILVGKLKYGLQFE